MADIITVTQEEASKIIETRLPLGKFICREGALYIGIDNDTGDAWTEEFKSRSTCVNWLNGKYQTKL